MSDALNDLVSRLSLAITIMAGLGWLLAMALWGWIEAAQQWQRYRAWRWVQRISKNSERSVRQAIKDRMVFDELTARQRVERR